MADPELALHRLRRVSFQIRFGDVLVVSLPASTIKGAGHSLATALGQVSAAIRLFQTSSYLSQGLFVCVFVCLC